MPNITYRVVAFDEARNYSPYSAPLVVSIGDTPARAVQDDDPGAPPPRSSEPSDPFLDQQIEIGRYNRTRTEALSVLVNGPSRTDPGRALGAPSAPSGLVALLTADNWVELDWVPSVDDSRVVAYEIYRDRQLVGTLDGQPDPPAIEPRAEELRALRTTTYIDCNFTKDLNCQSVGQPQPGRSHTYEIVAIDDASRALPYHPFKIKADPEAEDGRALKITAIPTPPELLERANGQPYLSGGTPRPAPRRTITIATGSATPTPAIAVSSTPCR